MSNNDINNDKICYPKVTSLFENYHSATHRNQHAHFVGLFSERSPPSFEREPHVKTLFVMTMQLPTTMMEIVTFLNY